MLAIDLVILCEVVAIRIPYSKSHCTLLGRGELDEILGTIDRVKPVLTLRSTIHGRWFRRL
jgi:hypothetical protein